MTKDNTMKKLDQLVKLDRKAEKMFSKFNKGIRRELVRAMVAQDTAKVEALKAYREDVRSSMEEIDRQLEKLLLSREVADHIEAELKASVKKAEDLSKEMDKFGRTLDRVAKVAQLASGVVSILSPA